MRTKAYVLPILFCGVLFAAMAASTPATAFIDTKNGVTVHSSAYEEMKPAGRGYTYQYDITNNSTDPMDKFYVYLNTGVLVFSWDYFDAAGTKDKLLVGETATLFAWLTEFNPPQPDAQYAKGYMGDPWWTDPIDAVGPILVTPFSEPVTLLVLVPGLLALGILRRRLKR